MVDHEILLLKWNIMVLQVPFINDCVAIYRTYSSILNIYNNTTHKIENYDRGPTRFYPGPLLLIIYMNDIYTVSHSFEAILYADHAPRMVAGLQEVSRHILKAKYLSVVHRLSLNFEKTRYVVFHSSGCKTADIMLNMKI